MKDDKQKLTLDRRVTYLIKVPGEPGNRWSNWNEQITVTLECDDEGLPITVLSSKLDQAALQGLLRRLYSLGLPLISVNCLDV